MKTLLDSSILSMKWALLSSLFLLLFGCGPKKGMVEFINVCHDHQQVSAATCQSLIMSIDDEIDDLDSASEQVKILKELQDRLRYMDSQADVIYQYAIAEQADQELIARLIKNRWKESEN